MASNLPKTLHPLGGKPLLKHILDTAYQLNPQAVYVVVGHGSAQIEQFFSDEPVVWVEQKEQRGTAHALQQALDRGAAAHSELLVLFGDVPLVRASTLQSSVDSLANADLCILTTLLEDPTGYGRILRDTTGELLEIVEHRDASVAQLPVREVNTGVMAMRVAPLAEQLAGLSCDNAQNEYYLPHLVANMHAAGFAVCGHLEPDPDEFVGVNDRLQLALAERYLQRTRAEEMMRGGVTLSDPHRIDMRGSLAYGRDVTIDINCVFSGENSIGDGAYIGPGCVLHNARIGAGVQVHAYSIIEDSQIGDACSIGPFARLRPGTTMESGSRVGNFVELKNSQIGEHSKVNHLSYIGDSTLGEHTNIGAGTITANYDGRQKHKTQIGAGCAIGSNSVLIAPLTIGERVTVGAGSVLSESVGADALALTRAPLITRKNKQRPADAEGT